MIDTSNLQAPAVILNTSPQSHGTGYRAVVSRELRSATGDVLNVTEADFVGF